MNTAPRKTFEAMNRTPRKTFRALRPFTVPSIGESFEEGQLFEGEYAEDSKQQVLLISPSGMAFSTNAVNVVLSPDGDFEYLGSEERGEELARMASRKNPFKPLPATLDKFIESFKIDKRTSAVQGFDPETGELTALGEITGAELTFEAVGENQPYPSEREVVYISGPMTGIEDFNYPAFNEAEDVLNSMGYRALNPARMDKEQGTDGLTWHDFLKRDLHAILDDDRVIGVVFIEGWRNSRGATLEGYVAQQAGKKVWELVQDESLTYALREVEHVSVAYAAQNIVLGARRFDYGHPLDNFLKIAELFNATIGHKLTEPLDLRDVSMLMLQVKVAREYNSPKEDNRVDIVGYTLAYDEGLKEMERRGGNTDDLLSDNVALLRQHSVLGADKNRKGD